MRRRLLVIAALAAAAALPVPAPAAASQVRVRHYAGETSQGEAIRITSSVRDGVVRLRDVSIEGTAVCEDGTSYAFGSGVGFARPGPRLVDQQLDLENVFSTDAFLVHGRLGSRGGSGTAEVVSAALDALEEPQICTTGELTWQVRRVPRAPTVTRTGVATIVADGVVRTFRVEPAASSSAARVAAGRVRSYEGRTSAGDRLFVITFKRPDSVALLELGFQWELACDDQTSVGLGFFILFAEEPLEPGRLDYDLSAPYIALHVHGELGAHLGSGTTSAKVPALTPDLGAMACATGDQTWQAWRTDAGARPL